jgi:predicted nucleic acid-binding protein
MKPINVVSNTSPLIFLEKIDLLILLKKCFNKIVIPEKVMSEWGKKTIPDYITVKPVSEFGKSYVLGAVGRLHQGELEAIQLAIELNYHVILLDDVLARRYAEKKELLPLGVLGILKLANRLNFLTYNEVCNSVSELTNNHGLYISPDVLNTYLNSFR